MASPVFDLDANGTLTLLTAPALSGQVAATADSKLPTPPVTTSPCQMPPRGTIVMLVVLLVLTVAGILLSILVPKRHTEDFYCDQRAELATVGISIHSYDNDPFDFSILRYAGGFSYLYMYQNQNTNETKGPRILIQPAEFDGGHKTLNAYSWKYSTVSADHADMYSFELTIGKNASDGSIAWAGLKDKEDGNVTIDPSVVHLRFGNNDTYNIYNDTVFLISYQQVTHRAIDLTQTVSSVCGIYELYQRAEWKALLNQPLDMP
jgi:hypothetical protein